jgi:hypothetical protein
MAKTKRTKRAPTPPTCIAVVICDDIFTDKRSNKKAIWGTFNSITADRVPFIHPKLSVLVTLTNGRGTRDIRLAIDHEQSNETMMEIGGPMIFKDGPLQIVELALGFKGVPFTRFGKYWLSVKSGSQIIGQRPFFVRQTAQEESHGNRNAPQADHGSDGG